MKLEEQRIAIAEWCGFSIEPASGKYQWNILENGVRYGVFDWLGDEEPDLGSVIRATLCIPDYLNDLNAMHEAESRLSPEEWGKYVSSLASNEDDQTFALVHATATQKSRSLLVAIGKWTDSTLHTKG